MQLFALAALINYNKQSSSDHFLGIVKIYLKSRFSSDIVDKYVSVFLEYQKTILDDDSDSVKKISLSSVKILRIAQKINQTLDKLEKFIILIRLIEFLYFDNTIDEIEMDLLNTLANVFTIENTEFNDLLCFVSQRFDKIIENENLSVIDNLSDNSHLHSENLHFFDQNIDKPINILFIKSISTFFFKYNGTLKLRLTGRNISPNVVYLFDTGAIIRGQNINPIYQTTLARQFFVSEQHEILKLVVEQIEYKFKPTKYGIHKLSFSLESGSLVGVMGPSGSGKTTLLNMLIGKYKPSGGKIYVNGYDINEQKEQIRGLIGFVPQDDLLIEELTVYQNLYYCAKLSFGEEKIAEITEKVDKTLKELDLYEIKDLKVGNPLNKYISGGQRKRLNIAMELIREPSALFVDEPTSGLSSLDSELVMDLLKHQALSGKLVVVNIHQPSSDIFKLFDKILLLDKGGYTVYLGNPLDAIGYFKEINSYVDYEQIECSTCGNVRSEEILEIVEEKAVDQYGRHTEIRKTNPQEWYTLFRVNLEKRSRIKVEKSALPKNIFKPPKIINQFRIFFSRDLKSKFADKQYMIINLFEAPILAILLAFFSKKIPASGIYSFAENSNIPVFLFMTVIVALFLGLSCSAEELIKDRRIIEREQFLNLNRFSYLVSKTIILMMLSAYQSLTFLIFSFLILQFHVNFFVFWLITFLTAFVSNILGLIISSAFKNVVTIYILIPLILVPQMLLGGAMIKYDDMHPIVSSKKYVPFIADGMFARWAYEAFVIETFKNNPYYSELFDYDKQKSEYIYYSAFLVPELKIRAQKVVDSSGQNLRNTLKLITNEFEKLRLNPVFNSVKFNYVYALNENNYTQTGADSLNSILEDVKYISNLAFNQLNTSKDSVVKSMESKYGVEKLALLKINCYNEKLSDILLDRMSPDIFEEYHNELIRKKDPVFIETENHFGRAHFYSAYKYIGNFRIDTVFFNSAVLSIFAILMFIVLYFDWLKKIIDFLGRFNRKEAE